VSLYYLPMGFIQTKKVRGSTLGLLQTSDSLGNVLAEYQPGRLSIEKLEGQVLHYLFLNSPALWTSCFVQHQAYPAGLGNSDTSKASTMLAGFNKSGDYYRSIATENIFENLAI